MLIPRTTRASNESGAGYHTDAADGARQGGAQPLIWGWGLAERKRVFDENLSDCTNVHDDSDHYARALGATSPIRAQRSIRQGSLDWTWHLAGGDLLLDLASLPSNSVCGASGCARSNLAT